VKSQFEIALKTAFRPKAGLIIQSASVRGASREKSFADRNPNLISPVRLGLRLH
jgi:hypothetical protein